MTEEVTKVTCTPLRHVQCNLLDAKLQVKLNHLNRPVVLLWGEETASTVTAFTASTLQFN